jgi:hypothetical protein
VIAGDQFEAVFAAVVVLLAAVALAVVPLTRGTPDPWRTTISRAAAAIMSLCRRRARGGLRAARVMTVRRPGWCSQAGRSALLRPQAS